MHRTLILFLALLFAYPSLAQDGGKEKPLPKEAIDQLEFMTEALEDMQSLEKQFDSMMRARGNECLKSFGHLKFCTCLNEKLAAGLSFRDYIVVMATTKEELGYPTMPLKQKQLVDSAIKTREQCVMSVWGEK